MPTTTHSLSRIRNIPICQETLWEPCWQNLDLFTRCDDVWRITKLQLQLQLQLNFDGPYYYIYLRYKFKNYEHGGNPNWEYRSHRMSYISTTLGLEILGMLTLHFRWWSKTVIEADPLYPQRHGNPTVTPSWVAFSQRKGPDVIYYWPMYEEGPSKWSSNFDHHWWTFDCWLPCVTVAWLAQYCPSGSR